MTTVAVIVLLVICVLWVLTQSTMIDTDNDRSRNPERAIIEEILTAHTESVRYSRPVLNVSRPVWVSFGLVLNRVLMFDEQRELLTVVGWNRMVWHDEYLPWNASASGVTSVRLPADKVWTPDIHSYNGLERTLHVPDVVLSVDGLVLWVTQKEYSIPCSRNLNIYEWTCRLRVSSTTYDGSRLVLGSMWHSVDMSSFESHGHVLISETTADKDDIQWPCCAQPYPSPSVVFTIVIKIQ